MGIMEWDGTNKAYDRWYGQTEDGQLHAQLHRQGFEGWGIIMWGADRKPLGIEDDERYTRRYPTDEDAIAAVEELVAELTAQRPRP